MTPLMKPTYVPHFMAFCPDSKNIYNSLLSLDWLRVTEARKEYFMADKEFKYSYGKGIGQRTYTSKPFISEVQEIIASLRMKEMGSAYNVCFLNRYDTQKNQLGWHADDSPEMDGTHPISVISFGAEREIWVRIKGEKGIVPPENRFLLGHGSLFYMPSGFQEFYEHRIPKCDRVCGIRISLTFRKYK